MKPSPSPELHDNSYVDYADAIGRESFLKSLQQVGRRSRRSSKRPRNDAVDAGLIEKTRSTPDPAE